MATYLETYDLAHNEVFRHRIQVAVLVTSRDILNEDADDQTGARYMLARQATRLDEPVLDRFAWGCALNPTIATSEVSQPGSSADSDLTYVVASAWNRVAGVA